MGDVVAGTETETWLSQEAYERLESELEELRTEGRERIAEEIKIARQHGDLSENAEYDAAKEKQGRMEARIRQLEALLRRAKIGEPEHAGAVAPGLTVTLNIEGDQETYLVGSREEEHDSYDVLSTDSPIGRAVLGREVDDHVEVEVPAGSLQITIEEIATP